MMEYIMPADTNTLGNLNGGKLMYWIDIAGALAAARHCNNICVTAEVDRLTFKKPIKLGDIVRLKASVNRAFNTSVETGVRVEVEDLKTGELIHTNSAYLTFVNIDKKTGKSIPVPQLIPETSEEKRRYKEALKRREARLSKK